jgi:fatty acid/phospholipid biosynthesis enzyme
MFFIKRILQELEKLQQGQVKIMAAIDDLKTAVAALQAVDQTVVSSLTSLVTHVEALQVAVAAGNDAAIATEATAIQTEVASLTSAVAAAAAVPPTP